jgi:hypothetical protein
MGHLFPNQPYNLQASFRPKFVGDPLSNTETHEEQARSWGWPWTDGLENGQTYKIGIVDGSKMKEWMIRSLDEILEMRKTNAVLKFESEEILFSIAETSTFGVRRP